MIHAISFYNIIPQLVLKTITFMKTLSLK